MADAIKRSGVMSDFKSQFLAWAVEFAGRQAVGGQFLSHCLHSACNEKQYYASAGKMTKVRMNHPKLLDLAKGIKYLCRWGSGLRVSQETFSILSGGEVLNTLAVMAMTASEMNNVSQLDVSGADGTTVSRQLCSAAQRRRGCLEDGANCKRQRRRRCGDDGYDGYHAHIAAERWCDANSSCRRQEYHLQ